MKSGMVSTQNVIRREHCHNVKGVRNWQGYKARLNGQYYVIKGERVSYGTSFGVEAVWLRYDQASETASYNSAPTRRLQCVCSETTLVWSFKSYSSLQSLLSPIKIFIYFRPPRHSYIVITLFATTIRELRHTLMLFGKFITIYITVSGKKVILTSDINDNLYTLGYLLQKFLNAVQFFLR